MTLILLHSSQNYAVSDTFALDGYVLVNHWRGAGTTDAAIAP